MARALLPGDRIENISIERVMTPEVLAVDELERAQAMLDALSAPEDDTRPPKFKKKKTPKKKKKKKKADKKAKKRKTKAQDDGDLEGAESTEVVPEARDAEDPNEDMPDEVEDREEAPTLNEGEKVDVIDPNAED